MLRAARPAAAASGCRPAPARARPVAAGHPEPGEGAVRVLPSRTVSRRRARGAALGARTPRTLRPMRRCFQRSCAEQAVALEHHPDFAPVGRGRWSCPSRRPARCRCPAVDAGDDAQRRGLAASGRASSVNSSPGCTSTETGFSACTGPKLLLTFLEAEGERDRPFPATPSQHWPARLHQSTTAPHRLAKLQPPP